MEARRRPARPGYRRLRWILALRRVPGRAGAAVGLPALAEVRGRGALGDTRVYIRRDLRRVSHGERSQLAPRQRLQRIRAREWRAGAEQDHGGGPDAPLSLWRRYGRRGPCPLGATALRSARDSCRVTDGRSGVLPGLTWGCSFSSRPTSSSCFRPDTSVAGSFTVIFPPRSRTLGPS